MSNDEYHYFVAHEFSSEKRDDLRNAIELAFKGTGFRPYYADIEVRQKHILDKIRGRILRTRFGIYDISTEKPNIFIELGLAIGAGKRYYIICEAGARIPADLAGLDRIEYTSYKHLTRELKGKVVKQELRRFNEMRQPTHKPGAEEDVLARHVKLYQAEKLHHRFGYEVEDGDASNGRAWYADLSELKGHIMFGPYEELPELGTYTAYFKIKIDSNVSPDPILFLDTVGGTPAWAIIRGIDFEQPHKYQLFGVEFEYSRPDLMEYRLQNQVQGGQVWVDYVAIVKTSSQE